MKLCFHGALNRSARQICIFRRPAKRRRVERTSHSQPARRKDHAHRTPCYSGSGPLTGLGCM